jgi:type VII secretion integral membrane protein EccD
VTTEVAADVCRVVLVAPHRTLEMALPQGVPLADLMPVLVQRVTLPSRPDRPGRSRDRAGHGRGRGRRLTGEGDWVLQRLGGVPLEEELTPAALHIHDGETLYLRPRDALLPPAHFDDLIDGLATGIRSRADRWRTSMTRAMFLVICLFTLGVCFVLLLDGGFVGRSRVAAAVAAILVFGAVLCSRALGDGWAGLTLGLAAVPFAGLAGFLVPARVDGALWLAPSVLCAGVAVCLVTLLAVMVVGDHRPVFLSLWLTSAALALGGLLAVLGLSAPQAAGTVVTVVLIAATFAPGMSFRLARLRLPQLPTGADDLAEDIEPYPASELMAGARAADTYLTCISLAVGMISAGGAVILARSGQTSALLMVATVSLVLMIRSRGLTSAWQRGSALVPAVLGPAAIVVHVGNRSDPSSRLTVVAGLLAVAGAILACSRAMPGRRLLPYWGRLVDFVEYVFAIALVVLLLAVLGAYQWARALAG